MRIVIVAMCALMVNASTEIGISSAYGGAYIYAPTLCSARVYKGLQSGDPIHSCYTGAHEYIPTPNINLNRNSPSSFALSSAYGGDYGYIPIPNVVNANKKMKPDVAISSGYGGAYGYASPYNVISFSSKSSPIAELTVPTARDLSFGIALSHGYGASYGYSLASMVINNNDFKDRDMQEMSQVMNLHNMMAMPQVQLNSSPGYTGYGNGTNSYAGYSRYPLYSGYGFAYASGWL